MRFRFTLFLLALNVLAFGLILYLGQRGETTLPDKGGLAGQLGHRLIEADRIELRGGGLEEARVLQREGNNWALTEPMRWPANEFAINRILNQLEFIEEKTSFPVSELASTGQSLADYGLENASLSLLIGKGETTTTLKIGTLTDIGNNVYLLGPDDERIYVIDRQVIDGLLLRLSDLRKREVFEIPVFEVQELSLQVRSSDTGTTNDLNIRLAKSGGKWNFEAPLNAEADPALVSTAINTLASVKVGRFLPATGTDPQVTGLQNPLMRVTLHGNRRRQTLIIGNPDTTQTNGPAYYYAKLEANPAIFSVEAKPFDELIRAQEALRERNFISFEPRQLDSVHIAENGRQLRLQKVESGEWQVLESDGNNALQPRRADAQIVADLMADIAALRATDFAIDAPNSVDLERLGFNAPRRTVELFFQNGTKLTLQLAHPEEENDRLYARTDRAEFIYEVERRSTLRKLELNPLHYRDRVLDILPESAVIQRLRLVDVREDRAIFDLTLPDGQSNWTAYLGSTEVTGQSAIEELLGAVRRFAVQSYLSEGFDPAGFPIDPDRLLPWRYRLEASVRLPGSDQDQIRELSYHFTERLSGTKQIGGSPTPSAVFEIDQLVLEALYQLTDSMQLPPEASGTQPAAPETVDPLPSPEPIPEAMLPPPAPATATP